MSINKINSFDNFSDYSCSGSVDWEEKMIMRRLLLVYGVVPTGQKSIDKPKLHELELKEAKMLDSVSSKFLTVTKNEQERIIARKKEKKTEQNPKAYPNTQKGAKTLGEQIYLAIQMKKDIDKKLKEKKKIEKKNI